MVIVTQNKQLVTAGSFSLSVDEDTPVLSNPLIIPDLRPGDVCSLWMTFIIDEKAKCSITFNDNDYSLIQDDKLEEDTLFEKRVIYYFGDRVNFQFDKDVTIKRMKFAWNLDTL